MSEMDIFFKEESKPFSQAPVAESDLSRELSPESMKEVYINYNFYMKEVQRLHKAINDKSNNDFPGSNKRLVRRFEKFDRLTTLANQGLDSANLTDKEWTVVDMTIDGLSNRKIGGIINHSGVHVGRLLDSAMEKICDVLNGN